MTGSGELTLRTRLRNDLSFRIQSWVVYVVEVHIRYFITGQTDGPFGSIISLQSLHCHAHRLQVLPQTRREHKSLLYAVLRSRDTAYRYTYPISYAACWGPLENTGL